MLYGLETQVLGRTLVKCLEDSYRTLLRRVQSLTQRVAKKAVYMLMGVLPLEAILHMHMLKLLVHEIALRQLTVKEPNSHSWLIHVA